MSVLHEVNMQMKKDLSGNDFAYSERFEAKQNKKKERKKQPYSA